MLSAKIFTQHAKCVCNSAWLYWNYSGSEFTCELRGCEKFLIFLISSEIHEFIGPDEANALKPIKCQENLHLKMSVYVVC